MNKTITTTIQSLFILGLLLIQPLTASAAGNTLEAISFAALPGDEIQFKLTMSKPASEPLSFTINDPARIALDFTDTSNKLARKSQTVGLGLARSITAIEAKGRTRVVLNLVKISPYKIKVEGNIVFLTLSGSAATASQASSAASAAAPTPGRSIANVDFRRGEQGEARLTVMLSNSSIPVDVRQEGTQLIIDFIDASLPSRLERRLDVLDFATPVKFIDTFAQGNNVRMVIDPVDDNFEHLAYQSDNTFTLDVKAISKEEIEQKRKAKFGFVGEKLSLNFQNIEVRAVLQLLADFASFNLVTSDTVTGNVTLRLKNVPWDQAMDIILKTKGLAQRKSGNVVFVAPTEEIASREKLELESQKELEGLKPLRAEVLQINYARASDIVQLLHVGVNAASEDSGSGAEEGDSAITLSQRGSAVSDPRTNTILIQDTAERIEQIRELLIILDIPVRQVLIEGRIVIANDDFSKDLGVRFGFTNGEVTPGNTRGEYVTGNLTGVTQLINNDTLVNTDALNVNMPAAPSTGTAATFALAIAKLPFGQLLQLELSALQAEGRGEVVSNPRVVTANGVKAYIEQGTEIPYLQASSSGAATVAFKKAVLSLTVVPQITPDDSVIMDLTVTQDSVGQTIQLFGSAVPSIDTQEVKTRVLVDNGETVVLGGVYKQVTSDSVQRVPFFGDLPYVGWLFKTTSKTNDKDELLVFVTPKIMDESLQAAGNKTYVK
ncbi:MAG: type 4a pilus secretin PilQ [Gammaproteobacteria bacterium]|nr:MAG: type 4a pilus secretin PilQ [Gammaproteobacteria bacterium]